MGIECEIKFFDLGTTLEPKPTLESKSSIPQNHILLLDQGIDQNDSLMIFIDWSVKRIIFMTGSCMILLILGIVNMYIEKRSIKVGSVSHHIILIG